MITKEEYGKVRTVAEFIAWVNSYPDQENKKNIWIKKFNQEAGPLRHFLTQYVLPASTQVQLDTTEDSYDALLIVPSTNSTPNKMKFQIVSTETEETLLMYDHLKKYGMAWLPAGAKGNLKKMENEEIENDGSLRSKNEIVHENIDQIIDRINKKISKKYADKLYLLVSFNDFFLANMPGEVIKKFVLDKILPNDSFIKIYLVSENKLIEL